MIHDSSERKVVTLITFICGLGAATAVNYLGKDAAAAMTALTLSSVRLLIGAAILAIVGIALGLQLRPSRQHLWRYALIGPLTMAVPQGLLFMGLRSYGARPIDAAITEAAIPGLILVYLFATQRRVTWGALIAATTVLLGLAAFLGFFNGTAQAPTRMTAGSWFLLVSAAFTSFGLICDDNMAWPAEPAANGMWRWQMVHKTQATKSLRKTLFGSLISGVFTLVLIPFLNPLLGENAAQVLAVPPSAWPGVVALALVGTCITWFSIFLLIQMQQMVLIVALVASIPVVSAAYDFLSGRADHALQGYEWFGGALLVLSLLALIYAQLMRPPQMQLSPTVYPLQPIAD
jgi:drug/metabolite transporter (DMT)-like permease